MAASPLHKLKAQLAQLDALIAEGVLKGDAAKKSRDDLERQLVAAVLKSTPAPGTESATAAAEPRVRAPRPLVAGVTVFVLAFSVAGYAWLATAPVGRSARAKRVRPWHRPLGMPRPTRPSRRPRWTRCWPSWSNA
jgi:cytochrome c-type biogenesis protein CcmH/NrfG